MAALHFGAGVEQPFGCLIVQNGQAVLSMRMSMDQTLEDNMIDSLFICATLTGTEEAIPHLYRQEQKRTIQSAEAVKTDPGSSWEGHSEVVGTGAWD